MIVSDQWMIVSVVSNWNRRTNKDKSYVGRISDGQRYALGLRHFFVDGSKPPVVDELERYGYFSPKNCWALNFTFGHCTVD